MTGLPRETFERIGGNTAEPAASLGGSTLANPSPAFFSWATNRSPDDVGPAVNEWSAWNYTALYTALSLIAQTIACLPLKVFRRRADGGQDVVSDHPAANLLGVQFNANTASMTGRETQTGHLLSWGNSYTQIVRSRRGELLELNPLGPDIVTAETTDEGDLFYTVRAVDSKTRKQDDVTLPREQVLHVPGFSFDSLVGISPIRVARDTIRGGLGQDRRAMRFVSKGFRKAGVIELPPGKKFKSKAEADEFRNGVAEVHNQSDAEDRPLILQDGAKWQETGVDPESAQLLESRMFSRGEIAGLYKIPPHLMGDMDKTTAWGTGIEELNIGFAVYCLVPILRRFEQELNRKLFRPDLDPEEAGLFVEHSLDGLLRGDVLKRSQALEIKMRNGVISDNEWRRLEGMNPKPGGDMFMMPMNMTRLDEDGTNLDPEPAGADVRTPPPTPPSGKALHALRKTLARGLARCLRKEAAEAVKLAKRPAEFVAGVEEFYSRHAAQVRELYDTDLTAGFADRHLSRSKGDLLTASECSAAELADRVAACVERWQTERVAELVADLTGELAHA
jgi:HK97 family phage portal protein